MKVKVEKVGHILTFLRLLLFGIIDPIFAGSGKSEAKLSSSCDCIPLEMYAAESSCNSQPSSKLNLNISYKYDKPEKLGFLKGPINT